VLVADPAATVVDTSTGRWVVSATKREEVEALVRGAESVDAVRDRLAAVAEDAVVVHVGDDRIHGYRTLVGSRRLYYLRDSDGRFVVTDHFRNALAQLDVVERTVSTRALVDHLLFRAPSPPTTFVDRVHAVGQGEWFVWDPERETATTRLVDRFVAGERRGPRRSRAAVVDALDETLETFLTTTTDADTYNLFSGGVDSTLVQSYLDDVPMCNVGIDSPEYQFEVEYATEHSKLFETPFRHSMVPESDLLSRVEETVDALGTPSMPFMAPLMNEAFNGGTDSTYVMSVGADALYGARGTKAALCASLGAPLFASPVGSALGVLTPGRLGEQLGWLSTVARQQRHEPTQPESFPQQFAAYTKPELVTSLFGREVVADRCRKQVEYVRSRVETDAPAGFPRQIELAHLLSLFGHRSGSRWRQLASTYGNTLVMPFQTQRLTRHSLSVPADRRYVTTADGGLSLSKKHLLKQLLDRRLPSYPTDQAKGSGVLPFERYFADGCLADVFERYAVPSFVPPERYTEVVEESGPQAWNLVTYAIWRDRVLNAPNLTTTTGTRSYA
jgi:asparagine synthetase B (glutamine-hydrolysing)